MPDPVTIGSFVVAVFTKAAESGLGELAKSAAKDAYVKLKALISQWAGGKAEVLEEAPDSEKTRTAIVDIINGRDTQEMDDIFALAKELSQKLSSGGLAIGMELVNLKNAKSNLKI